MSLSRFMICCPIDLKRLSWDTETAVGSTAAARGPAAVIAFEGDPEQDVSALRRVMLVTQSGAVVRSR